MTEEETEDQSVYVSWCIRCGQKCECPGKTATCPGCGEVHDREWPAANQLGADGKLTPIKSSTPKTVQQ